MHYLILHMRTHTKMHYNVTTSSVMLTYGVISRYLAKQSKLVLALHESETSICSLTTAQNTRRDHWEFGSTIFSVLKLYRGKKAVSLRKTFQN